MDKYDLAVSPTSRGLVDRDCSHFADEKVQAHRNWIVCLRPQSLVPGSVSSHLVLSASDSLMAFNFWELYYNKPCWYQFKAWTGISVFSPTSHITSATLTLGWDSTGTLIFVVFLIVWFTQGKSYCWGRTKTPPHDSLFRDNMVWDLDSRFSSQLCHYCWCDHTRMTSF